MNELLETLTQRAIKHKNLSADDANELSVLGERQPFALFAAASAIRSHYRGNAVTLCGIANAKSGRCAENCRFCAQSAHYQTGAPSYPLVSADEIVRQAREAKEQGAHMFGIVTSGTRISTDAERAVICEAIAGIATLGLKPCASLGMISSDDARRMKEAGLHRYHHNLETSRSFFPSICTTHEYDEDVESVRAAKEAGLSTCSGGIIGLGETMAQRIELALTLRELDVDSVPINILNPIAGTPLEAQPQLPPLEILTTIALFRFILPDKDIKLCGGKEKNLRQLLPLGLVAGCSSLMTGNYLTTTGRDSALDIEMIRDLGLDPVVCAS